MTSLLLLAVLAAEDGGVAALTPSMALLSRTTKSEFVEQLLDDGKHQRFGTEKQGPVHVWRPAFYRPDRATVVVYLHGYFTDVDTAFEEHQLSRQFRDSGRNALFIVPEAPSWRSDPVFWPDLEALLLEVEKRAKVKLPKATGVLVLAHSGAYRTVLEWTEQTERPRLEKLVMLDAHYAGDIELHRWLELKDELKRQLVLVGFETSQRSDWFVKKHVAALKLDDLPWLFEGLTPAQKTAPILFLNSERFDHMGLVTEKRVIPWLLHALP